MRTNIVIRSLLWLTALLVSGQFAVRAQLPIKPVGDSPTAAAEGQELTQLFTLTRAAAARIAPGPEAGFQRRQMADELDNELETFLTNHVGSVWSPSVRLWLARHAQLQSCYLTAMDHYVRAWDAVKGLDDARAWQAGRQATAGLARLLALTGRMEELDALEAEARSYANGYIPQDEWSWANAMRVWARKHPTESYKCGLYCLDQLGRLTQPGRYSRTNVVETESSTNGFTAAELVRIGTVAGLQLHAALLHDLSSLPVPCIVHLRSEHFVVVRKRHGEFYEVYDPVAYGSRWLLGAEVAREASGCVVVSDVVVPQGSTGLTTLDATEAAVFRGRCHPPEPDDHFDNPCPSCPCPPGRGGVGGNGGGNGGYGNGNGGSRGTVGNGSRSSFAKGDGAEKGCSGCGGMPIWVVSEPYLNLWLTDVPLAYSPAYGPQVELRLAYNSRATESAISGVSWHGAQLGNHGNGEWACSWLSAAELGASGDSAEVMLPGGGWAAFTFPTGSEASDVEYYHSLWLEKQGSPGVTNLVLHYPDGSYANYGVLDDSEPSYAGLFYRSDFADPAGAKITFTYDPGFLLTNVTAADGTAFSLSYTNLNLPKNVTGITSSYGASVQFTYATPSQYIIDELIGITDAAGIASQFVYQSAVYGGPLTQLLTPYGTTTFDTVPGGIFDRTVRVTQTDGTQVFYGMMNSYSDGAWSDFAASQIPTNTPVGTLDTADRQERNTYYWNAQQFAPLVSTSLGDFTWAELKLARIRHWLSTVDTIYTHFSSLSLEQAPSPDGTAEGQVTWYDYTGKPSGSNGETGTQIWPSLVARVMPDGSTAYQYFERLTNGLPTKAVEKWEANGIALYRTNTYSYAANNVDLTLHTGPYGEQVSSNVFNAYHQVATNYDALNQKTTYTYDGTTRQLTSVARPTGLVTTNYYDGSHRLQQTTDLPINATESYTWGSDGNVKTVTDARSLVVTNYWDGLNRLTGRKYPDGTTTTNLYTIGTAYPDSTGGLNLLDVTATKDRLGYWTYYGYDSLRRLSAVTNANNAVTRYGYCDCGGTSSVTNAWGTTVQFVISYDYDYQGHRIFTYYPDATVTNWFDALGRSVTRCDAWGCRWFGYDNLNRLTSVTNAFGAEQITTFDLEDRPIHVTDANNVTITNTYDDLGRLRTRTYPDGGVEKFGYSARGLTAYTNQLGYTNSYAYDEAQRKTCETNANWDVIRYTNNAAGDLLALVDGKNQVTKWNYDSYGRVTNKVDQAGAEILRYTYDADSRLASRWSRQKGTTYYTNDAVGNLTKINHPASPDITLAYDPLNRVTNMVDAAGTTKYTYTVGGQLYTEDGPFTSDTVTNTYNHRLRVGMDLQQPTGVWTNRFAYDAAKRLTNVISPAGSFGYALGGSSSTSTQIKKLFLPNGSYITNTYDVNARLLSTKLLTSSSSLLNSHSYSYNPANQRTQQVFNAGSTVNYTYDPIGQLKVADSATASEDRGYAYDAAWNLHYRTNNTTLNTLTVDGKNQLTTAFGGNCGYDSNGNLTNYNSTTIVYTYDDENQLTRAENVDKHTWATDFVYDGLGRLRKRIEYVWGGGVWTLYTTTCYLYDGKRVIQERNASNVPQVSYTRGTDLSGTLEGAGGIGGLLARSHGYSAGNWSTHNFYHADGNGNVTYLVNSSQTLAASYRYDPYGNTISSSGTLAAANTYRFSSKELHVKSGFYYYGFRWYDPYSQRWLNGDPLTELGHGMLRSEWFDLLDADPNLYAFVHNDPMNEMDAFGLLILRRNCEKERSHCIARGAVICALACAIACENPLCYFACFTSYGAACQAQYISCVQDNQRRRPR